MRGDLGRPDPKAKFRQMFSNNRAVNVLAAARIFLFASRDVWFVVGLPVFLRTGSAGASGRSARSSRCGSSATASCRRRRRGSCGATPSPTARTATLARVRARRVPGRHRDRARPPTSTRRSCSSAGLIAFGVVFALNSAVHSYLILAYADGDKVAMNVGFYYMANAGGRLAGTVLSGALYQWQGLEACLWASVVVRARRRRAVAPAAHVRYRLHR